MKKTTIYLENDIHSALKRIAADEGTTMSALTNEALKNQLLEDAEDIAAFAARKHEQSTPFDAFVRELK